MNGNYKADGRFVRKEPKDGDNGTSLGFIVCELSECLDEGAAKIIADALNLHKEKFPEKH